MYPLCDNEYVWSIPSQPATTMQFPLCFVFSVWPAKTMLVYVAGSENNLDPFIFCDPFQVYTAKKNLSGQDGSDLIQMEYLSQIVPHRWLLSLNFYRASNLDPTSYREQCSSPVRLLIMPTSNFMWAQNNGRVPSKLDLHFSHRKMHLILSKCKGIW